MQPYALYPKRPMKLAGRTILRSDGLPLIMGILNLTPDSFSDGGHFTNPRAALAHAEAMLAEGADFLDIGAESSRPGADPLTPEQEWARIAPVLPELVKLGATLSIDTYHATTAGRALDAGCEIVNDISGGNADPDILRNCAESGATVILMHMRGAPKTMQQSVAYDDVVSEVMAELRVCRDRAQSAGIPAECIWLDPGFGFSKLPEHNIAVMRELARFRELGPVLLGASRKSTLAHLSGVDPALEKVRLPESLAVAVMGALHGADMLRVHDVGATVRALRVALAMG